MAAFDENVEEEALGGFQTVKPRPEQECREELLPEREEQCHCPGADGSVGGGHCDNMKRGWK